MGREDVPDLSSMFSMFGYSVPGLNNSTNLRQTWFVGPHLLRSGLSEQRIMGDVGNRVFINSMSGTYMILHSLCSRNITPHMV